MDMEKKEEEEEAMEVEEQEEQEENSDLQRSRRRELLMKDLRQVAMPLQVDLHPLHLLLLVALVLLRRLEILPLVSSRPLLLISLRLSSSAVLSP